MSIQPPSSHPREISVTEPVSGAYERVKLMLFHPFDLGKWFALGFCAWLARLGESGGYGGNFGNYKYPGRGAQPLDQLRHFYDQAHDYALANLAWLVPLASMVLIILLGLGILFAWLNSRGKFMFLHCVALNKAEIEIPWDKYAGAANRLFGFRLVLGLAGLVLTLPLVVILVVLILRLTQSGDVDFVRLLPVMGLGMGLFLLVLMFALIHKFMVDFVVPIMYLRGGGCRAAWREFLQLLADHAGHFVLYLLFQIVLAIAIGMLLVLLVIFTCCVAGCFMALPYLGAVLLLPILIFNRSYSLYYLAQFGPQYDVFPPSAPPVAVTPPSGLQPL